MYNSIKPGKLWLDTEGKPIQAHGFDVVYDERLNLYYWVGANHEFTQAGGNIWHWGVKLYTSTDLYNWEDRGIIIPPSEDITNPLHSTYRMDRPHIIYCPKTQNYVAWIHIIDSENNENQFVVIMQSKSLYGPYDTVNPCYFPLGMNIGDFSFFYDKQSEKQYIFYNRAHWELICAELNDDYTSVTERFSTHFSGLTPPFTREAPVCFERNGKKFLFTSATTGYYPNSTKLHTFEDFHGEYTELCDPCVDDKYYISFNSQVACVVKHKEKDLYIACADRWIFDTEHVINVVTTPKDNNTAEAQPEPVKPDLSPRKPAPMCARLLTHEFTTSTAGYVWLPITFENGIPKIYWQDEWTIE